MTPALIGSLSVIGAGIIFMIISIPFFMNNKKLKKNCTATTTGKVIKYRFSGKSGAHSIAPVVEFVVDGKKYKAYRHYKAVSSVSRSAVGIDEITGKKDAFYISDNDVFHINTVGSFHNYKKLGEEKWPIGSELNVVYNPNKPKQAFVEKVVTIGNIAGIVLLSCGALFILLGILFDIILA